MSPTVIQYHNAVITEMFGEPKAFLTTQEAMRFLDCKPTKMYELINARRIPFSELDSVRKFSVPALIEFMEAGGTMDDKDGMKAILAHAKSKKVKAGASSSTWRTD